MKHWKSACTALAVLLCAASVASPTLARGGGGHGAGHGGGRHGGGPDMNVVAGYNRYRVPGDEVSVGYYGPYYGAYGYDGYGDGDGDCRRVYRYNRWRTVCD